MNDTIFREYDIRGKVGKDFRISQVYDLTRAIVYYLHQKNPTVTTIAIGMDGRIHSPAIKDEICRALIDSGMAVLFLGTCPSPSLYFALHTEPIDAGLMITASHNGKEYNGIKICSGTESVWGKELQRIKQYYQEKKSYTADRQGTFHFMPIIPRYIAWLADQFPHLHAHKLRVVVDCGNGATGSVLPQLCTTMQWDHVQLLYTEIDGTFPHHAADPTVPDNMRAVQELLQTTDALFGVGFDGDGDRMAIMTKQGTLIPGDQLLSLFVQPLMQKIPHARIVFDIKSSSGLSELLERWGAQPIMSPSGHSIIKDMMRTHHALIGGELSCHFFFKDRAFGYDDGVYAMLRFFEIIAQAKKSPEELLATFPCKYSSPEFRIPCPEKKKAHAVTKLKEYFAQQTENKLVTIDGVHVTFPFGWGIVRASNTQPALSMRFESTSKQGLKEVIRCFKEILQQQLSAKALYPLEHYKETV